jgi:predicted DCC family thiol-disulfide oxidoreductase YuxK
MLDVTSKFPTPVSRYLLFDSGCSVCTGLAQDVERESDGRLAILSLRDPRVQSLLGKAKPGWRWEPTLCEVEGEKTRVSTGIAMRTRMLAILGPHRTWKVARLVARAMSSTDTDEVAAASRRRFLKQSAAIAGVVGLMPLGSRTATAAKGSTDTPGPGAVREGVKAYKVEEGPAELRIRFTHAQASRSGTVGLSGMDGPQPSIHMTRRGDTIVRIIFNRADAWISAEDGEGRRARTVLIDGRWTPEGAGSAAFIEGNLKELALAMAIYSDFEVGWGSTTETVAARDSSAQGESLALALSCPCAGFYEYRCSSIWGSRSTACEDATSCVSSKCSNQWCWGCCRFLACDCYCAFGDYACMCGRTGYGCTGRCT